LRIDIRAVAFALMSCLSLVACGGDSAPAPAAASEVVVAPAPAATTAPVSGCRLGLPKGSGPGVNCPRTSPVFMSLVEGAVNRARDVKQTDYPLDDIGYRVTAEQLDAFFKRVVDDINAGGQACAYRDGLELAVKSTNDFSEQYKFWVTSGHLRLGDNAYRATCTPAWF
jgi:hypothetical protein